jgi:iron complex transport system ATP-binding protein
MLQARGLELGIGHRVLLKDLDLSIRTGEFWCVLGPNGCGKTTLMMALSGLARPTAGIVTLHGRLLSAWGPTELARTRGFLPQAIHDAFGTTALEAVVIGRHPHIGRWRWEDDSDRTIALRALEAVDALEFASRDVLTLSGGERQRVAIASLLAQDSALMFLDEPVSHLDPRHQVQVMRHLSSLTLHSGKAVMVTLHDVNLAARHATHVAMFMPDGQVVAGDRELVLTEERISAAYQQKFTRVMLGERGFFVPAEYQ